MKSMKRRLNSLPQFSTSGSTHKNSGMPSFGIVQLLISARTINNKKSVDSINCPFRKNPIALKFVQKCPIATCFINGFCSPVKRQLFSH